MGIFIEAATEIQASKKVYQILLFKQMHNHLHDAFLPFTNSHVCILKTDTEWF